MGGNAAQNRKIQPGRVVGFKGGRKGERKSIWAEGSKFLKIKTGKSVSFIIVKTYNKSGFKNKVLCNTNPDEASD